MLLSSTKQEQEQEQEQHMSLAFSSFIFFLLLLPLHSNAYDENGGRIRYFARTRGTQFMTEHGEPFYPNGFNAYWLKHWASQESERGKVSMALQQASQLGLNVVRTWAFNDGGYRPLQYSPGSYNEAMFQGLDFVLAEASKYGTYVILSLVNSDESLGGRKKYVEWANEIEGQNLTSQDDFYTNYVVKGYYKNHVKAVLTRINTITGKAYKDDPTIFAWELMNEPRCMSDPSGKTLQGWITEMAAYVKSIDSNHLLEVGLEGFYGESVPGRMQFNPNDQTVGSDFILNNRAPGVDFATIHVYPDLWIPQVDDEAQLSFLQSWIGSHIQDAVAILGKPLLIAEFGKSSSMLGGSGSSTRIARIQRDALYRTVYDIVYASAKGGGSCTGGLFWQLLLGNGWMDALRDGYEIILSESPSTANIIAEHSQNMGTLKGNSFVRQKSEPHASLLPLSSI